MEQNDSSKSDNSSDDKNDDNKQIANKKQKQWVTFEKEEMRTRWSA